MKINRWLSPIGPRLISSLFVLVLSLSVTGYLNASDWSAPAPVMTASSPSCYNKWPSINGDGTKVVFLTIAGIYGAAENDAKIRIAEYAGEKWNEPVLLASNGHYSDESFQWLPWHTQPVISRDGNTIAYAGYEASPESAQIYIIDRDRQSGAWRAPDKLPTGIENHDSIVSLSDDGNTIAYVSRPFNIFGDTPVLYVSVRSGAVWGAKTAISSENSGGAFNPSLSGDGARLVWVQNEKIVFSERIANSWTQPQVLAENKYGETTLEYPVISPDGTMVVYWQVNLVSSGSSLVRQSKDLFLIQRTATGWSGPRKITPTPVVPGFYVDGPAGMSGLFNRIAYSRSRVTGDVMNGAGLEWAELSGNNWVVKSLTDSADSIWDLSPSFSQDGNTIIYQGTNPSDRVCNSFWFMKSSASNTTAVHYIAGSATFKGAPLAGVNIALSGSATAETTTDLRGNYGITGLSDGLYTVTPSKSGFQFTPENAAAGIAGADVSGKDFTAFNTPGTISFSGSVVDSTLRAMPDCAIEVPGNPALSTKSDANGNFLLAGIPAGADFSLKISGASSWYLQVYTATYNTLTGIRTATPFILHGGQDFSNFGFPYGALAEGKVFRAGHPSVATEGAVITCTSKNHPTDCATAYKIAYNSGSGIGGAATSANGIYYISGIEKGDTVTVTATKEGWRFSSVKFTANEENFNTSISELFVPSIIDLADAVACLQIVSGQPPQASHLALDVNNDGKIALPEVLYILQYLADLR